ASMATGQPSGRRHTTSSRWPTSAATTWPGGTAAASTRGRQAGTPPSRGSVAIPVPATIGPHLLAVAAALHRAPPSRPRARGVHEHEAAVVGAARPDPVGQRPAEDLDELAGQRRQRRLDGHGSVPPTGQAAAAGRAQPGG